MYNSAEISFGMLALKILRKYIAFFFILVLDTILQSSCISLSYYMPGNKPVQNFASKVPCYLHLKVKSAM